MKVSIKLMQTFSSEQQWRLPLDALVRKIGEQLGAVEEVIDLTNKYDGIIVGEIVSAEPHPNADKLNVYHVTDGENNAQVVSGDTLIQVGDKVAWLRPGTTVPSTWGTAEPFVLSVRDMRGMPSNGMFGSGKELDVNSDHSRVLILDTDAPAGTPFAEVYGFDDAIIDIENKMFTHRPDGFGNLGVAREIAGIQNLPFQSPDWYVADAELPKADTPNQLPLAVKNNIPALVPRYTVAVLDTVRVAPSPLWLQATLQKLGIRPINNVVDITNYMMVVTGQPLHAFDYDKLAGQTIVVRHPDPGEKLPLLDGRVIEPREDAMLICDAEKPIGLGGMMGGANSEISQATTRIVLESATFDMFNIRRSSMHHGIFTDAVTRFSKGQSPRQTAPVLAQAVAMLQELAGATVAANTIDEYPRPVVVKPIVTTSDFINSRLGSNVPAAKMAVTLRNVEINVEEHGNELVITPPFWRTDLEIPEDIVEEVGRLHGYATLPTHLPKRDTKSTTTEPIDALKSRIRTLLAQAGANELQTYSFVPARLLAQVGQEKVHAFGLRNALSPELEHYRLSLTPSLLDKVHPNIKAGYKQFGLFELNKIHIKGDVDCDGLPREYQTLAFVFASDTEMPGAAYYHAKKYLDYVLQELGVSYNVTPVDQPPGFEIGRQVFAPFEPKHSGYIYMHDGAFAGFVGEYRAAVGTALKLPKVVAGFEIDLERVLANQHNRRYQPLLKFPATEQDVCLKVAADVAYADLYAAVAHALPADKRLRVHIAPLDIYQRQDDTSHKQITFRITLQHHDRTLTTTEVNTMLDDMVAKVAATHSAERI